VDFHSFLDYKFLNLKKTFIFQTKYIKETLKKFRMEDCTPVNTPMVTGCKLSKDDESSEENQTLYKSMIGNLLYVMTSRLDIMQASRIGCIVSSYTKRNSCTSSENNIQISKGNLRLRLVVLKK
jgi:hypothetical protein